MDKFTVVQLKELLRERELSTTGIKAELCSRLTEWVIENSLDPIKFAEDNLREFEKRKVDESLHPEDSASQASNSKVSYKSKTISNASKVSSLVSERVRLEAQKAELEARKKWLEEKQKLELEMKKLKQIEEMLEINSQLSALAAKEKVYKSLGSNKVKDEVTEQTGAVRTSTHDELLKTLVSFNMKSLMPKTEIKPFSGDYTQFQTFMKSFDSIISSKLTSDSDRLYYLSQYTTGKPLDIITSCMLMPDSEGYKKARSLLEKRYGDSEKIISAYIRKVLDWPAMKPDETKQLDEFSILLHNCKNAVSNVNDGSVEVEHSKTIREIVRKLPFFMQERWRRRVHTLKTQGSKACFADLVSFVEEEAEVANDSSYGRDQFSQGHNLSKTQQGSKNKGQASCNTTAVSNIKNFKCWYCGGDHFMDKCKKLRDIAYDERVAIIKGKNLCFKCLGRSHTAKFCTRKVICDICKGNHNTLMHRETVLGCVDNTPACNPEPEVNVNSNSCRNNVRMNVIPIKVQTQDGRSVMTYAFLDSGSSASFCSESLCRRLGIRLDGRNQMKLDLSLLGQQKKVFNSFVISDLILSDLDQSNFVNLPFSYVIKDIPASNQDAVSNEELRKWSHLSNIELPHLDVEVEIMLGNDMSSIMEPWEVIHSPVKNGPYAVRTILGWYVCGIPSRMYNNLSVNRVDVTCDLDKLLIEMYNAEFKELNCSKTGYSVEDRKWLDKVTSNCNRLPNGHYEILLPFKDNTTNLPCSKMLAYRRLNNLRIKMDKNDQMKQEYIKFLSDMIDLGYAEKVSATKDPTNQWYIPHFAVMHPQKQKLRVVFDCAAKVQGISLNDTLIPGPDMTSSLLEVLIRFRLGMFAYTADIAKMFYQVYVPVEDRDFLRFLWWDDGDTSRHPSIYRMTVHLFGAASSPSVASYALKRTALDNKQYYDQSVIDGILDHFYVDDCLKASNNEECLAQDAVNTKELCARGGFNLEKFVSPSKTVCVGLPDESVDAEVLSAMKDRSRLPIRKVLGLEWDLNVDKLCISFVLGNMPQTKRDLLKFIASLYDPLGMAAPFVLFGRLVLQESCRQKLSWDDRLPIALINQLSLWFNKPNLYFYVEIDRNLLSCSIVSEVELHIFSDASLKGYGVVAYLRVHSGDVILCNFVFGKARVAPLKAISIPRLELTAASLAVKVHNKVIDAFKASPQIVYYWTDSTTVLRYINNECEKYKIFVANRLSFIRDHSHPDQWRYVPSKLNPADEASRGQQSSMWLQGPDFLKQNECFWPKNPIDLQIITDEMEINRDLKVKSAAMNISKEENPTLKLIHYFSDWYKLKRIVAHVRKFLDYLQFKQCSLLTTTDLKQAELAVLKVVQGNVYEREISDILSKGQVRNDRSLCKLKPIIGVDGLLRVGGRLQNSNEDYEVQHPVILPNNHHITRLIIKDYHEKLGHLGRNTVLANLRCRFWIIKGNRAVRSVLNDCIKCRKVQGKDLDQCMAELPKENVVGYEPLFTSTGLDCFGPFFIKHGRSQVKRYGLILVCLATRAVHLEVLADMSTSAFINGLRRFLARRGAVKVIRCDRGTNFIGASRELKNSLKSLDHVSIGGTLLTHNVDWVFNPPQASHFGGAWERQIRTVRKVLMSVLNQQSLTDDCLHTLFCEIETTINSRPLTTVSSDASDPLPLSPNLLLTLKGGPSELNNFSASDCYARSRWKRVQYLADLFWSRWTKEYLTTLHNRCKWTKNKRNLAVGDVVLIKDEMRPRNRWPLGLVVKVHSSNDGLIRSATLKCEGREMVRPITKLVLMLEGSNN